MRKDSVGNLLPSLIIPPQDATMSQLDIALSVNTFNLAVDVSMQKGDTVVYDDYGQFIRTISHL